MCNVPWDERVVWERVGQREVGMNSMVLERRKGVERVVHVLAPRLVSCLEKGIKGPCVAVRESCTEFRKIMVCFEVEILGRAKLADWFDRPLPGTNGRGVLPLVTKAPIRIWFPGEAPEVVEV